MNSKRISRLSILLAVVAGLAVGSAIGQSEVRQGGLGIALGMDGKNVVINQILPDSPAAQSKALSVGDRITAVEDKDGKAVKVSTSEEAIKLIRGPVGTIARLTIVPAGKDESQATVVSLARGDLKGAVNPFTKITLKPGDPAPALKATRWLQGDQVTHFAGGKIYVIEFWATWCGPCLAVMPHIGELQREYRDKGVTFIGFTSKDRNNTEDKVTAMVKKRGPKLGYAFAYAEDRDTYEAWMYAAGQEGIPCSFVVDRAGNIAYIGHPMFLDLILPKVADGSWKPDQSKEQLAKIEKEIDDVSAALRSLFQEKSLKTLEDFEAKYPRMWHPNFIGFKLKLLVEAERAADAQKLADAVIAHALHQEDPMILQILSSPVFFAFGINPATTKQLLPLSLKAAEAYLKLSSDKDADALLNLAMVRWFMGDMAEARELGQKAIAAADSPELRQFVEEQVKLFDQKK